MLVNSSSADFYIRRGIVGIAVDAPDETSEINDLSIRNGAEVVLGDGCEVSTIAQHGGQLQLVLDTSAATTIEVFSGRLMIEGSFGITTLTVEGGEVHSSTTGTITTVNHNGGTIDYTLSDEARTVTTHNLDRGAILKTNPDAVTITNLNEPSGPSTLSVSP